VDVERDWRAKTECYKTRANADRPKSADCIVYHPLSENLCIRYAQFIRNDHLTVRSVCRFDFKYHLRHT